MSDNLKSKTLHGLFWSFFERIGQQGIQFVISIILARILLPTEFGLIAMLTIFMAVAQSFIDSGFFQKLKYDLYEPPRRSGAMSFFDGF